MSISTTSTKAKGAESTKLKAVDTEQCQQIKTPRAKSKPKTTAAKTTGTKATRKPPAPKAAARKQALETQLTQLETRLKRANRLTQKNVKTLEHLVESLQSQSQAAQSEQGAAFASHVKTINEKLTRFMAQSQADISRDLSTAAQTSEISEIANAISRSEARLAQAEISQADAMVKVNRHLANLATTIEARFAQEAQARTQNINESHEALRQSVSVDLTQQTAALKDHMLSELQTVEADTASALTLLGDKIETFANVVNGRKIEIDSIIGGKLDAITSQTQADLSALQDEMQSKLSDISQHYTERDTGQDAHISHQMQALKDRLQMLEHYIADMDNQKASSVARRAALHAPLPTPLHAPAAAIAPPPAGSLPIISPSDINFIGTPRDVRSNVVPITDAFTPAKTAQNPYAQPAAQSAAAIGAPKASAPKDTHLPIEFNAQAYAETRQAVQAQTYENLAYENLEARTSDAHRASNALAPQSYAPDMAQDIAPPMPLSMPGHPGLASQDISPELPPMGTSGQFTPPPSLQSLQSAQPVPEQPMPAQNIGAAMQSASSGALDMAQTNRANQSQGNVPLPYADPAYAENNDMRAERIGADPQSVQGRAKRSLPKLSLPNLPISGRYIRLLLIGSAIAAIGIFAGKIILGGPDKFAPVPVAQSPSGPETTSSAQPSFSNPVLDSQIAFEQNPQTLDSVLGAPTSVPIGRDIIPAQPNLSPNDQTTLRAAATNGNPIAQYQLGRISIEQNNIETGVTLLRAASAQNLPAAQYALAQLYETGKGVTRDPTQALRLTELAAQSGHRIAMHDLALYYTDEQNGVAIDVAKAENWFQQAAQFGVVDSQYNLAVLAELKEGPNKDLDTAYFWYSIAAQQGDQFAQQRKEIVAGGLTPERLAAAEARIASFKPRDINPEVNGIFNNLPWGQPVQSVKIQRIRQAQTYLADLGYDVGSPDGAMGPRTRAAIAKFEKANALDQTGEINDVLLDRLELEVGA